MTGILLLEPFLRRKFNCFKVKPLLDQFQGSYRDKYHCMVCSLLSDMLTSDFYDHICHGNYQNRLYCLQTACVIIVLIHI